MSQMHEEEKIAHLKKRLKDTGFQKIQEEHCPDTGVLMEYFDNKKYTLVLNTDLNGKWVLSGTIIGSFTFAKDLDLLEEIITRG